MSLSRRSSRLAPGSAFLIGLLLLMLGLSGVLGYQALDAARAEARSTNRALRGYAELARWELSRRGDMIMEEWLVSAAVHGRRALDSAEARGDGPRAVAEYAAAARGALGPCRCPGAVKAVFRADPVGTRRWTVSGEGLTPAVRARLERATWMQMLGGPPGRMRNGDTVMISPVDGAAEREELVFQTRVLPEGGVRAYGMVVDTWQVGVAAVREVLDGYPLLPHPVGRGLDNREAVAVVLTAAPPGQELYRYPAAAGRAAAWVDAKVGAMGVQAVPRGAVSEMLGGMLAPLTARVSGRRGGECACAADNYRRARPGTTG